MQPEAPPAILQFVPIFFLIVIFYFLIIRPQQKKQKEHQAMIRNLAKNDEVVTVGGMHGTIVNVKETTFIIRVDDATKVEIDKHSIAYVKRRRSEN
ncbi:MAG: preprotein translocase subunit YajC [Candidatus Omnitrophota bacterium]|nr:MAG: preprotein translocase subunit YajC [Candidatus Omnitrophota bacterium]